MNDPFVSIDLDDQDRIIRININGQAMVGVSAEHRNRCQQFVCREGDEYFEFKCEPGSHLAELLTGFIEAPPDEKGMPIDEPPDNWLAEKRRLFTLAMKQRCACAEFEKARQSGSEPSEGWPSLIGCHHAGWVMGYKLATITYCPWCGRKLRIPTDEDRKSPD